MSGGLKKERIIMIFLCSEGFWRSLAALLGRSCLVVTPLSLDFAQCEEASRPAYIQQCATDMVKVVHTSQASLMGGMGDCFPG